MLWSLVEVGRKGAPILLEEPELSLHPAVIRMLPTVLARAQRSTSAQILLTTHSPELLQDEGIRPDEVLILTPTADGTEGLVLSDDERSVTLVDEGMSVAEVALPLTEPPGVASGPGPEYASLVAEYSRTAWRPEVAAERAPSLRRTLDEIERLVRAGTW